MVIIKNLKQCEGKQSHLYPVLYHIKKQNISTHIKTTQNTMCHTQTTLKL